MPNAISKTKKKGKSSRKNKRKVQKNGGLVLRLKEGNIAGMKRHDASVCNLGASLKNIKKKKR